VVQVSLATVHRTNLRAMVPVTGVISPLPGHEARVAPMTAGRIRSLYVKTGDIVQKGQTIAVLDPGPLSGQLQQAEAAVQAVTSTLQQARLNLTVQERSQSAAVEQAQGSVRTQQAALDKVLAGARPQEVAQAQSAVTAAQAALTNAEQSLARSNTLFGEGLLARKDVEAAQTQQKTADAQLRSAQEALSLVRQGSRKEDIQAGRLAVQFAQAQLRAAQAQSVQNASKAQDVAIAAGQLQAAQGALRAAQAQLAATTVRAPISGTVVGRTLNPGETADVTAAIATIVDIDQVRVLLNVPAAQVAAIRVGEAVEFSLESQPGVVHHANISVVNRAVDAATNTIQIEAATGNADRQLRDDGFVRGEVVTAVHAGALTVPAGAVVDKDGKSTVFVVGSDNIAHARDVKTGLRDGGIVEVLSGLRDNERVVTTGAYEINDGMRVNAGT
jgi:HlyD family secretion protein